MSDGTTYAEKLKDPRWQKKRLKILERDGFRCVACGSETKTLHVHHNSYIPGAEPWDHPDSYLVTLCADCHETEPEELEWQRECIEISMADFAGMSAHYKALDELLFALIIIHDHDPRKVLLHLRMLTVELRSRHALNPLLLGGPQETIR